MTPLTVRGFFVGLQDHSPSHQHQAYRTLKTFFRWCVETDCAIGDTGTGRMFVIAVESGGDAAGSVVYWERDWRGERVWEIGWSILPEFQGQGIATRATAAVARAGAEGKHRSIHAFPSVANGPSNAICRKVGFTLLEECDFEYPPGSVMRCNDWVLELPGARDKGAD